MMLSNVRIRETKRYTTDKRKLKKRTSYSSPFSRLTLTLSPTPFSPSPTNNSSVAVLTAVISGCSLNDQSPRLRILPLPDVPGLNGVVRADRRSLKELNSPPVSASLDASPEGFKKPDGVTLSPVTPFQSHKHSPTISSPLLHYLSPAHSLPLNDREKILALCEQKQPQCLSSFFPDQMLRSIKKLGEGTFAEVFGCTTETGRSLAIKIIPIEGDLLYNDEPQTTYHDVLTEMAIMKELSLLGEELEAKENKSIIYFTENFLKIHQLALCVGEYPVYLLEAWDEYAVKHRAENDRPDMFPTDQLYILMATENAGTSLENYEFSSVEEAISVLCQVAGALAVGEAALELEHRDLHLSNVLVKKTSEESFLFQLDKEQFVVPSHGVKATIVDYTLSRMKQGSFVSFNNLERLSWLFEGEGDIQYDVYRDMRKTTSSCWDEYHPYTNVLWLRFLLTKLSERVMIMDPVYRRSWRAQLRPLVRNISRLSSAQNAFIKLFLSQI